MGSDDMKRLILALIIVLSGCATPTKPNPVYQGPLPDKFSTLEQKNPLLAKELCKALLVEVYRGLAPKRFNLNPYWQAEKEAREVKMCMWSLGDKYISPKEWRSMQRGKR